jgi:Protein of unknown function (DUF4058)
MKWAVALAIALSLKQSGASDKESSAPSRSRIICINLRDVIPLFPLPLRSQDQEPIVNLQELLGEGLSGSCFGFSDRLHPSTHSKKKIFNLLTNHPHTGSAFNEFLREEGLYEECNIIAIKRLLARRLAEEIK